ncbi:Sec1 family protein [Histomonas meleagridis]|uniref:Sec1 family protein n=1 Tax=Histomonas meleagridis TaxID=135588 RepID=UPI003559D479|nr:Sec1 family protein [Histomonas meleagridis]KAH0799704.1 Sec1 family protein [Histomonas meleagridis]
MAKMTKQKDSIFDPIIHQALNEFKSMKLDKNSLCIIPYDYLPFIECLLSINVLGKAFSKVITFEEALSLEESSINLNEIISIVPNEPEVIKELCQYYKKLPNKRRTILISPVYDRLSQIAVENSGIESEIMIIEFHADLIAIENYEFLVPTPHCFRHVFAEKKIEDLRTISRALVKIEAINGIFPKIYTFGPMSSRVKHIMNEMKEHISISVFDEEPSFSSLIILDRTCDLFTPLMTEFTYEGILYENLSIRNNILNLPTELNQGNERIILNNTDKVYRELRGMQLSDAVEVACSEISAIDRTKKALIPGLDTNQFKTHAINAKRLAEIKPRLNLHLDIMNYLAMIKSLDNRFKDTIEFEYRTQVGIDVEPPYSDNFMLTDRYWDEAIRQYCIECIYNRGLSKKKLHLIRRRIIERFGMKAFDDILNLEKVNLLTNKVPFYDLFSKHLPTWEQTKKLFNLMVSPDKKDDFGSFYDGGYVPLICRLVEETVLGKIGHTKKWFLEKNQTPFSTPPIDFSNFFKNKEANKSQNQKIMVFVIGGVVPTEVSIIKSMGLKLFQGAIDFYVGATSVTSGKALVRELCPTVRRGIEK